jgi:hypothetical protein
MWATENRTPYAVDRNWLRDKHGRHHWLVALRASFDIEPNGKLKLADEQVPPPLAPEYRGEPAKTSLRWDSDLLYRKPCTDVVAEANAHAPGGRERTTIAVRMRVGPIDKELIVYGPRMFYASVSGISTTAPEPFLSRPVIYEWAYGGMDMRDPNPANHGLYEENPVGRGFTLNPDVLVGTPAPAIEYRGLALSKVGPAGLGPIEASWLPRRRYAGTYDAAWVKNKKPLLPDDYDDLYGSCAPKDQRPLRPLRGGEPVELTNLTVDGTLRCSLPALAFAFETHFGKRAKQHDDVLLTTVFLQPELRKLSLTWQSALVVAASDVDYLDKTIITEKPT